MKLQNTIISVIIISMVLIGCITYFSDLGANYGETADLGYLNNTANYLNKTQNTAEELYDEISTFELDSAVDVLMIPYKFFQIGWKIAKIIVDSWGTLFSIITDGFNTVQATTGSAFPIYLLSGIISIIMIILVVIILFAWFKWKFED